MRRSETVGRVLALAKKVDSDDDTLKVVSRSGATMTITGGTKRYRWRTTLVWLENQKELDK